MSSAHEYNSNIPYERRLCLWEGRMFSDVKVRTEGTDYHLHKTILCEKSAFFFTALNGEWKEAKEGVVDMTHLSPSTAKAMLKYIYLGEYDLHETDVPFADQLLDHADIHAIGMFYCVDGLPEIAARNFEHVFRSGDEREQIDAVVEIIPFLCETIPAGADSGIIDDVSDFIAENLGVLRKETALADVLIRCASFNIEVYARIHVKLCEPREIVYTVSWEVEEKPATAAPGGNNEW
ncbi:uncharacterized protein J3D65DRAFT_603091 [Phyllosticta citribraziliensis]|uniref:BTB domain-containing protein n=1 Tax=Phyllosticta citribraziliensis TaxID=989973 RepID=A0ABR1LPE8_9PEZI